MQKPKHLGNKQKYKGLPVNWDGLGNEPRNENLARIRVGSFEREENDREKESGPNPLCEFEISKSRVPRR